MCFLLFWESICRQRGQYVRPSIWQPWHCEGSRPARKYKMGLGPISEMESPPGWNPRILLQQLDSTEDTQKPYSEIGFGNWVWALFGPSNLSVGLRVCLYFITFWLFNYFLITVWLHAFHFYSYQLCTLVLLVLFWPLAWNEK